VVERIGEFSEAPLSLYPELDGTSYGVPWGNYVEGVVVNIVHKAMRRVVGDILVWDRVGDVVRDGVYSVLEDSLEDDVWRIVRQEAVYNKSA